MSERTPAEPSRPWVITVICVLMALGSLVSVPLVFTKTAHAIGPWYPPFLALSSIVGLICLLGFWQMRRWAVFLYSAMFLISLFVLLAHGKASFHGVIIPLLVIASGIVFLPRMR